MEKKIQLRCKAKVNEIQENKLRTYLQKRVKLDKLHLEVLEKINKSFSVIFMIKELSHEDKQHIARELIHFFDEFYATDSTGQSIYGVRIAEFKSKQTYSDSFEKQESQPNLIPVHIDEKKNNAEFEEIYNKVVSNAFKEKIQKRNLLMRFLRIFKEVKTQQKNGKDEKESIFKASKGWRF